jgi:hypothetical protein
MPLSESVAIALATIGSMSIPSGRNFNNILRDEPSLAPPADDPLVPDLADSRRLREPDGRLRHIHFPVGGSCDPFRQQPNAAAIEYADRKSGSARFWLRCSRTMTFHRISLIENDGGAGNDRRIPPNQSFARDRFDLLRTPVYDDMKKFHWDRSNQIPLYLQSGV